MSEAETNSFWQGQRCLLAAGFLAGALLMLPGIVPIAAPVQAVALVPLLLVLRQVTQWRPCLYMGALMGLGFIAPQILVLQLPPTISLVLILYFVALLTVFVAVSWRLIRPVGITGALAFGAWLAVLEWVTVTTLPMWGTAQSFARGWSAYPRLIAFSAVTGMPGVLFVLGASQALAMNLILDRRRRLASAVALIGLASVVAPFDAVMLAQKPMGHLKVAAVGWVFDREYGDPGHASGFARLCAEPIAEAARQGARLVVLPEAAFSIYDDPRRDPFAQFVDLAREHNLYLAVGYLTVRRAMNRMAFIGPTEGVIARYSKTHMTPFESSPKGDGEPVTIVIDGVSVGAMICHDDNYTDISRGYGRHAVGLVVVPTNDWRQVRRAHFQSAIHRAVESRFAIVRAASDGISAIISPEGTVLDVRDHFRDGAGFVMADVPVYETRTIFSRYGHWFVALCAALLAVHLVYVRENVPGIVGCLRRRRPCHPCENRGPGTLRSHLDSRLRGNDKEGDNAI